ncbi:beta-N-acetylhexosaminidase [Alteromonas salexigens]|nr:beta-N-acetylhexosaminidase [Alteromonas salexigens]
MLDCQEAMLLPEEREKLAHPSTGGVILFARNYYEPRQLQALISDIRKAAGKPVLIAVDHEGGRVQRFKEGFTLLPAMGSIPSLAGSSEGAETLAQACGTIAAWELKQFDIDLTFAPVLDINGVSQVIGDRAFADNAEEVIRLAKAFTGGVKHCNMPAIGKHFPGHGSVAPDSHIALPVDDRGWDEITVTDMVVFQQLIAASDLDGIMPAHVIYSQLDDQPAGFSSFWLQQVLRKQLQFQGAVFSDDLSMHGASVAGDYLSRATLALQAGCDMVLACNNVAGAEQILDGLPHAHADSPALLSLTRRPLPKSSEQAYRQAKQTLAKYG